MRFRMRDSANGNRKKVVRLAAGEFIGRFIQHVLPGGFKRIRHYGLIGPAHKAANLAAAREALAAPAPDPVQVESMAFPRTGWSGIPASNGTPKSRARGTYRVRPYI